MWHQHIPKAHQHQRPPHPTHTWLCTGRGTPGCCRSRAVPVSPTQPLSRGHQESSKQDPDIPLLSKALQGHRLQRKPQHHSWDIPGVPTRMGQGKHSGFPEPNQRSSWLWRMQSPPKPSRDFSWCHTLKGGTRQSPFQTSYTSLPQGSSQSRECFSHRAKSLPTHNVQEGQGHRLKVIDAETLQHPLGLQSWKHVEQPEGCCLSACTFLQLCWVTLNSSGAPKSIPHGKHP